MSAYTSLYQKDRELMSMKAYKNGNQLRLVGKAWEIRYKLRRLGGKTAKPQLLGDYLKDKPPVTQ
jgi:hypothetical protein